jgi:hypothetical protein
MHIYLTLKKKTTYEWLMNRKEKKSRKVESTSGGNDESEDLQNAIPGKRNRPSSIKLYKSKIVHRNN